ncbi:TPA: hypothetical protein DCL30_02495 [Candidatus Peribacteria bacterium]|nr:MAG: hypothetical protein A3J91_04375 [Candidatus Peribacteria bacterium RIFOXYC2_FULL_58_10]OGJ85119.1 MAG: hypothetical protein A2529_01465 [Candidatus Peribacteria bacterium RIFOXYD2_FULL_58_15]HAI98391.1 hypothetical protein [Candidatus Peribacteria bacterium]HAS33812.1 hypothetical protein [Candidatus Peribacteria bacterium]
MKHSASAPGKIILTGEYAVLLGYPGIALPSPQRLQATFSPDEKLHSIITDWEGNNDADSPWNKYLQDIVSRCERKMEPQHGVLTIVNAIPLQRGMGSSTALVIAVARCLLGPDCKEDALAIEDEVNPGHSGIDFAVIWQERALLYRKGHEPEPITLPPDLLKNAMLIDTGKPEETTSELVAWVRGRAEDPTVKRAFETISDCTRRLQSVTGNSGPQLRKIIADHHRAQVTLGIVPAHVQELIADIENAGGAAKVIGAGGRTAGGGIVLAIGATEQSIRYIAPHHDSAIISIYSLSSS